MKTRSLAAVLALSVLAAACGEENPTPVASAELLESGADLFMAGWDHYITVSGIRQGQVFADTAYFYGNSSEVILINPTLYIFHESGAQQALVKSEWGQLNRTTSEMVARRNVVLTIQEGDRKVESSELNYDPNGDRIWSDSLTVFEEGGYVNEGLGFSSDLEFRNVRVGPGSITGGRSGGGGPA